MPVRSIQPLTPETLTRHQSPAQERISPMTSGSNLATTSADVAGVLCRLAAFDGIIKLRLPVNRLWCTQPLAPCQSRILRQFSYSATISTGIALRLNTQSTGYGVPGPVRTLTSSERSEAKRGIGRTEPLCTIGGGSAAAAVPPASR